MKYVVVTSSFGKNQNNLVVRTEILDASEERSVIYGCSSSLEVAWKVEGFWNINPYSPLVSVIAVTHLVEDYKANAYLINSADLRDLEDYADEQRAIHDPLNRQNLIDNELGF